MPRGSLPDVHTAALPALIDPQHLIDTFGFVGLLVIVFAECGLLIGFFLPGDTLLFSADDTRQIYRLSKVTTVAR